MNKEPAGFAPEARKLLTSARGEAERLHHEYVGTEHILLALTHAQQKSPTLAAVGVDAPGVRAMLESIVTPGAVASTAPSDRPFTSRTHQSFELARQRASQLGTTEVEPVHLLLGLLLEGRNIAAQVLGTQGLTPDRIEAAIRGSSPGDDSPSQA